MARALVLGATGHIGAHIVRALVSQGHEVRAAFRNEKYLILLDGMPVEKKRVDLDTLEGLTEALEGCDWVFHAAGYYPSMKQRNRSGAISHAIDVTRRVMDQFRRAQPSRVVFTSSAATIRRISGQASTEEDAETWPPRQERSLYSTVKIVMEQEAFRAYEKGLPVVIVNPSLCIGEYDAHRFSGRLLLVFAKGRIPFYIDHSLNVVYTGDVGIGHVRAACRGRLGERYLLAAHNVTLKEFTKVVGKVAGVQPPRFQLPHGVVLPLALGSELIAFFTRRQPFIPLEAIRSTREKIQLDGSKAVHELGMPQTPLQEAVRRAMDWFIKNNEDAFG